MTPADAQEFGVQDKDVVSVEVKSADRSLVFGDVVCRVSDCYCLLYTSLSLAQKQFVLFLNLRHML